MVEGIKNKYTVVKLFPEGRMSLNGGLVAFGINYQTFIRDVEPRLGFSIDLDRKNRMPLEDFLKMGQRVRQLRDEGFLINLKRNHLIVVSEIRAADAA